MDQAMQLVRLVYISQATFKPFHTAEGMECHVAQILSISRKNNKKRQLFGALYYGNSNFFQCLEGEKKAVESLLAKIQLDTRHQNLKILHEEPIEQLSFQDWEMKYALLDQQARDFLKQHDLHKFDPYQFNMGMTQQFVGILLASNQEIPVQTLQQAADTEIPVASLIQQPKFSLLAGLALLIVLAVTVFFIT